MEMRFALVELASRSFLFEQEYNTLAIIGTLNQTTELYFFGWERAPEPFVLCDVMLIEHNR